MFIRYLLTLWIGLWLNAAQVETMVMAERAVASYRARKFDSAEVELRAVLQRDPDSVRARAYLVKTLIAEEKIDDALSEIRRMRESSRADSQFEAGCLLQELGSERAAELLRISPDSTESHLLAARSLDARGRLQEAKAEYQDALRKTESLPGVHFALGNIAWRGQDKEIAMNEFQAELRLNPNHTMANLRLGQILIARNAPSEALEHLERAVAGSPQSVAAHREYGRALRAVGQPQKALNEFRWVAGHQPNDESVHAQLASVYKALGDNVQAANELALHRAVLARKLAASQTRSQ